MSYYSGTLTTGIALTGTPQNPATVLGSGYITNNTAQYYGDAVYGNAVAAWDLTNLGIITTSATAGRGIDFRAGGTVTNAVSARIAGVVDGVYISGGAGSVANSGTIRGTATNGYGVRLAAGGTIVNGASDATSALIAGGNSGVELGGIGRISNFGTIAAFGTSGYITGVYIIRGMVVNGASNVTSALISSPKYGVQVAGTAGTVSNYATIQGTGGTSGVGIYLTAGGSVNNAQNALILGSHAGVAISGPTSGFVSNSGTIVGSGTAGYTDGIYVNGAGTVVNGAQNATTALISSPRYGVVMQGAATSTVTNFGTIIGGGSGTTAIQGYPVGIYIKGRGVVVNGAATAPAALVSGVNYAVKMAASAIGAISNFGTIVSTINENVATQIYPDAIFIKGAGAIVNGAADATSALISAGHDGIYITGTAVNTVANYGTIRATSTYGVGLYLTASGIVSNAQSGLISGIDNGIVMQGTAASTVTNFGTIVGIGTAHYVAGVYIKGNGVVVNGAATATSALISGVRYGIILDGTAASTVSNFGTIAGDSAENAGVIAYPVGVYINGRGTVYNGAPDAPAALISGANYGIKMSGAAAGTVINLGSIVSTVAENPANLIYPDAIYISGPGTVVNGAATATSALISGGFDGIAINGSAVSTVVNFATIQGIGTVDGAGIYLAATGIVSNAQNALIAGMDDGVVMQGTAASTLSNFGTIVGGGSAGSVGGVSFGVYIKGTGTVLNGATTATSALIRGGDIGLGMQFLQGPATVVNFGTIVGGNGTNGEGVYVGDLGNITNGASNAMAALISGGQVGVEISGITGTVRNYGDIAATADNGIGIRLNYGTVTNFGTVAAGSNGTGIYVFSGNVTNSGTIVAVGTSATAVIVRYGTFFNSGLVEGAVSGIELSLGTGTAGSGKVSVSGTVIGGTGIGVAPGGTAAQTVTVTGSVIGTSGTAVSLTTGGSDRLIVAPGAAFTGVVDGGGGASVLEIAATAGAAAGLAGRVAAAGAAAYVSLGSVVNFSALEVDPGATFGGSGALSFASLVNAGQIDIGAGNSLALGVVASAAATGAIDLEQGGTVAFHGAVAAQRLTFQPPGGTALIDHPEAFDATLSGFTGTLDLLDLTALNPAGATATLNASDQLVVADGTQSVALQLDTGTDYTGVTWQTSADGTGGTDVAPVCFCRGTRVLTERGEVAVEALRVGDRVATLAGSFKPITWIGFGRDLVTRRNSLARPIVVRKGALADGVPRRDLYLTHGHALYLDGVLIPVEHLVNHRSILWDEAARIVEYYHIELADHDVVLAEGAPAESYHDAGNRARFHNTRPGSAPAAVGGTCAPVATGGEIVELVWARLFERAGGQIEHQTTDDPDLHLVVAGERLDPASVAGGLYTFALAAPPAGPLFLRSRSAVPSLTGRDRRDHRRLGVAIRQIVLHGAGVMTCLDHDAPSFRTGGCHLPEAGHSWTDGELALPAALFAHLGGPFALLLHTSRQALRYPAPAGIARAA